MIAQLKPYPSTKDSGVAWLGKVPSHWPTGRLKSWMENVVEQDSKRRGSDEYIALEHIESWTGRVRVADSSLSLDSQLKRFRSGDVLFGKLRPYLAKVAFPKRGGLCVGEFLVLRTLAADVMAPYMELLLRSKPIINAINSSTFGARMPRADWRFIGGMAVAMPPVAEQAAIVRFLDHVDRRIHRYIRTKKKVIVLLEEQKQAIIHQAVTGQIDVHTGQPYPAYKHSGAEWLGEIPTHWDVQKLKYLTPGTTVGIVVTPSKYYVDEGIPCLRSLNVSRGVIDTENFVFISEDANKLHRKSRIFAGDIVVVRTGQAGTAAIVPVELDGANCIDLLIIRRSQYVLSKFMYYYLNSCAAKSQATELSVGAIQAHYNTSTLSQLFVPKVPKVEQSRIVAHIDKAQGKIDRLIAKVGQAIDDLNDYRTRLIADVVTGKLDVRAASAALPEVDPLALDDEVADSPDNGGVPAFDNDNQLTEVAG